MTDNIVHVDGNTPEIDQNKVISLFQFIKKINLLKQKPVLNITDYTWHCYISNISDDPENIIVSYRDRILEDQANDGGSKLLSVRKPEFKQCPEPNESFRQWLKPGWESFRNEASVRQVLTDEKSDKDSIDSLVSEEMENIEHFEDNQNRVADYEAWSEARTTWVESQRITQKTRNLFSDLYGIYFDLQRDAETLELVVANGVLLDKEHPEICHPVLTRRVKLEYDPNQNMVSIDDLDVHSELYTLIFQSIEGINLDTIKKIQEELQNNDYHPLDRNDTPCFLKTMIHQLSSESTFSEDCIPEGWTQNARILLSLKPCYILRKRVDGTPKAIEKIIENIQNTGNIPAPIHDIVSGGKVKIPDDDVDESIEEQLASVGGESVDILLSKQANKEQLEIAKRIERYNAVLVQGPPGTGKTHTIANLMGHFLAHGKSVLVTSQTKKALSVLKDKIAPGLQNLCVSVLEDTNLDMERSVDGITDYMSKTTSHEIKKELDQLSTQRNLVINNLASIRKKIFQIIQKECNCIVFEGTEISPSKAAEFVLEHAEDLSYIPGTVRIGHSLPLSFQELVELYQSNQVLTIQDEVELSEELPSPDSLLSPEEFSCIWGELQGLNSKLEDVLSRFNWNVENCTGLQLITFIKDGDTFSIPYSQICKISKLRESLVPYKNIKEWMKYAAVDGKNGGAYINRWEILISHIQKTCEFSERLVEEQFGYDIHFDEGANLTQLGSSFEKLRGIFSQKGKVSKLALMINKDLAPALASAMINGQQAQSAEDCNLILHIIELHNMRVQCSRYWNELLAVHDMPEFFDLDPIQPEVIAKHWIPDIQRYLRWYQTEYFDIVTQLNSIGIPEKSIFVSNPMDSDITATEKMLTALESEIPEICDICIIIEAINSNSEKLQSNQNTLRAGKRKNSNICRNLIEAMESGQSNDYQTHYDCLSLVYSKYVCQKRRTELLNQLSSIAPQWALAIQSREGIHGECVVPDTIEEAWKWKQLSGIIDDITKQPFSKLQEDSLRLSKEYRSVTALYAEKNAWYHLLRKTEGDRDMQQALQGWKLIVKKIGKGTGKNAPRLKEQARQLMSACQSAVPGWIMPINRALDSLDPRKNQFDIIIIDEASQSDLSALAILYMGKKLIIVGDDKQVSPMAVGIDISQIAALQKMYLEDKIPNAILYDSKTSIYDIAKTTFQPLMLREHFRCVPEIIGFSNMLSYDYKIKPLRDAGNSQLLPAVVNYRVEDGKRLGNKTNPKEANAIVALMQACMEQPEYKEKTFGVISLLGDEQVKILQRTIDERISTREIFDRHILCGNASNFQGDERDVIFLSVVDSGRDNGPIALKSYGSEDSNRKRYNVAASRAKDQLWVVDSLDAANDLKPGDLRKTLIEYSLNPTAFEVQYEKYEEKAESPFEMSVVLALGKLGYHLEQQWPVGAYRLDIVVISGHNTVAIECDGERYHSGEDKIRDDMERQTILERLGWRFIRIRGSEYYRNPDDTIQRVIHKLSALGIEPETSFRQYQTERETELLTRIKLRAVAILEDIEKFDLETLDEDTVAAALNPKAITPADCPSITCSTSKFGVQALVETADTETSMPFTDGNMAGTLWATSEQLKDADTASVNKNSVFQDSQLRFSLPYVDDKKVRFILSKYSEWLSHKLNAQEVERNIDYLKSTQAFCRQYRIINCDLFDITEYSEIIKLMKKLEQNSNYQKYSSDERYYYFLALRYYMYFLKEKNV